MPSNYLAQVKFSRSGGMPADACIHTWHFGAVLDKAPADTAAIITRLTNFYTVAPGGDAVTPARYFHNLVATAVEVKLYDLNDPKPRVPVVTGGFNLTNVTRGNPLPSEVAVCLSYKAAAVSGLNPARRRGRVYFGPLSIEALSGTGGAGDARPATALRTALTGAAARLLAANTDIEWMVWSPTAQVLAPVLSGYVDDAFDIQRRRGADPTARTVFP